MLLFGYTGVTFAASDPIQRMAESDDGRFNWVCQDAMGGGYATAEQVATIHLCDSESGIQRIVGEYVIRIDLVSAKTMIIWIENGALRVQLTSWIWGQADAPSSVILPTEVSYSKLNRTLVFKIPEPETVKDWTYTQKFSPDFNSIEGQATGPASTTVRGKRKTIHSLTGLARPRA